jgi:hypothetical protein
MSRITCSSVVLLLTLSIPARAESELPLADDVSWAELRGQVENLRQALRNLKAPLADDANRAVEGLLKQEPRDPNATAAQVQRILDAHCLIGVTINPESRVKAAPGPAAAKLTRGRDAFLLVKVLNQAGVTNALKVTGPQLRTPGETGEGRWLEASISPVAPLGKTLSGQRLEYVVLRLKAHESGKREATLRFDVGQGTQDLGFRAEVPILFTIE